MPLSSDTSPEVERLQVDAWRRMRPEEKAAAVTALTRATVNLAMAGIRDRYPDASPHEHRLRLAVVLLGPELARKAYPEIAALDVR